jgi:hypothetical protein
MALGWKPLVLSEANFPTWLRFTIAVAGYTLRLGDLVLIKSYDMMPRGYYRNRTVFTTIVLELIY